MDPAAPPRLKLLPWRPGHAAELVRLYWDPRVMRHISGGIPLSPDEAFDVSRRSMSMWLRRGYGPWAAFEGATGRFAGRLGPDELPDWPGRDRIEVGWELHPWAWRSRYATEGGRAALRMAFDEQGLGRVISVTTPANAGSRAAMRRCGLSLVGVRRFRGVSVVWYAIDRATWVRHGDRSDGRKESP